MTKRLIAVCTAMLCVTGLLLATAYYIARPATAASSFAVAPYVDMTNSQEGMLNSAISQANLRAFTAAFVIGSGCTPIWGDTLPVSNDPTVSNEIAQAVSAGAQVIVSFGGAAGVELAQSCTNLSQLTAAYQSVINTLHVTHIDFDVEGAAIADTASVNRRFQAINQLEAANPGLVVSITVPVLPTGLDNNGVAFIQAAASNHTRLDIVNIMAMDYYGSFDAGGAQMGNYAVQAAQNTLTQVRSVFPGATYAMLGITPMIGQNDDPAEIFTLADARQVVSFAQSNGIGRLAFWSVNRDQPCPSSTGGSLSLCSQISQQPLDFTRIFTGFSGGSTPTPTSTRTPTPTPTRTPTPTPTTPPPPPGNLVTNPGFEAGSLAGWNCDANDRVVTSPVHSGSRALQVTPTNSTTGQCTQAISVQANHTYTLSAYVNGPYAYLGVQNGALNWTISSSYTLLSVTFTTGASQTSITIYIHGWYAQGIVYADDFSLR